MTLSAVMYCYHTRKFVISILLKLLTGKKVIGTVALQLHGKSTKSSALIERTGNFMCPNAEIFKEK